MVSVGRPGVGTHGLRGQVLMVSMGRSSWSPWAGPGWALMLSFIPSLLLCSVKQACCTAWGRSGTAWELCLPVMVLGEAC